jgi:HEAT repeat protein
VVDAELAYGGRCFALPVFMYIYDGAVWTMGELEDAALNAPLGFAISELASRVDKCIFGHALHPDSVRRLAGEVRSSLAASRGDAAPMILGLGFTNSPSAVEPLLDLMKSRDRRVRAVAVAAYCMLLDSVSSPDIVMDVVKGLDGCALVYCVRALGDMRTPRSLQAIRAITRLPDFRKEFGIRLCSDLYLNGSRCDTARE